MPETGVGFAAPHPLHLHFKVAANYDLWCCLVEGDLLAWGRMVKGSLLCRIAARRFEDGFGLW